MKYFYRFYHEFFCKIFCGVFAVVLLGISPALADWQMFSDGVDTYLFNTQNGDVYVRFRKGGKNYEDVFVKMPAGVLPQSKSTKQPSPQPKSPSTPPNQAQNPNSEITQAQRLEAIKKSQEIMSKSLDSSGIDTGF